MGHVSDYQLRVIGTVYVMVTTLGLPSAQMIDTARQDAWLGYLPALALVLPGLWCAWAAAARFPGTPLLEGLTQRYPIAGRLVTVCYLLFFFTVFVRDVRLTVDFTNVALLQQTPLFALTALCMVSAVLAARNGVGALARMAELFGPPMIALTGLVSVFTLKNIYLPYLLPILEQGPGRVLAASWYPVPYLAEVLVLLVLVPAGAGRWRIGATGAVGGALLLTLLTLMNVLVLGPNLASRFIYPNYETVRQIRLTDFLDRWDLVIVGVYYPALLLKLGISLYAVCRLIQVLWPAISPAHMAMPVGALGLVCTFFFFQNAVQILALNRIWPAMGLLVGLVIPLLLFVAARPRGAPKQARTETP